MPKQDRELFTKSVQRIIDYLEEDERKDYFAHPMDEAEHIYTHIRRVREWIQEEVNRGLNVQNEEVIEQMNVNVDFKQIRAEVKERNILRVAIDKIREIATIGMPALALPADLSFDEKTLLNITEMCDDAIRQTDAARKK